MSGYRETLTGLRRRLNEVNAEYRALVHDSANQERLARMARLRDERLHLTTRLLAAEQHFRRTG